MRTLSPVLRLMSRQRALTIVAVFTIAIGIGATTSVFSLVSAVLQAPPPYVSPERLGTTTGMTLPKGARPRHVLDAVLARTARWLLAGIAVGAVVANFAVRSLSAFLFGVTPTDGTVYILAILGTCMAAAVAGLLPAMRAVSVDPLSTLKAGR